MKVVILAAGVGSRLRTGELPKPLVHLPNGKSILQMQIEAITTYLSIDQVILVVGHHKEEFLDLFPDLLYVYNPSYGEENTAKSLLRAVKKVDDDLIWLNGDLLFHPSVFAMLLERAGTNGMITNVAPVGEEEVKYLTDSQGRIIEVSKTVQKGQGEALGLNIFSRHQLPVLREKLEICMPFDYFERAVELAILEGVEVMSVQVESDLCVEIDFPEDLQRAAEMVAKWGL